MASQNRSLSGEASTPVSVEEDWPSSDEKDSEAVEWAGGLLMGGMKKGLDMPLFLRS
jgi:hypothetical protein